MPGPVFMTGDRVTLHTVEEDDLDHFARAHNDPDLRLPLCIDTPSNRDTIEEYFEETIADDDGVHLLVCADDDPIGAVMFGEVDHTSGVADLAYWILPEHQDQGYGAEAVSLLLEYGFDELRLNRVQAECLASNRASRGLLEALDFEAEGQFREAEFREGRHVDVLRYGLLASEWREA